MDNRAEEIFNEYSEEDRLEAQQVLMNTALYRMLQRSGGSMVMSMKDADPTNLGGVMVTVNMETRTFKFTAMAPSELAELTAKENAGKPR